MRIEDTVLALPSVRRFIDDICNASRTRSVVALIPDTISRVMVARLISNRLEVLRRPANGAWRDIRYAGEQFPALSIADQLDIQWPSPLAVRNVRNLLRCEDLPDLLHIRDFSTRDTRNAASRLRWLGLIQEWIEESRNDAGLAAGSVPKLCLVAKLRDFDFKPPEERDGLSIYWWWGFPSSLEVRLACRFDGQKVAADEAANRWREQVLPAIVGTDFDLAEHLWDSVLESTDEVIRTLEEYALLKGLSSPPDQQMYEFNVPRSSSSPPSTIREQWGSGNILSTPEYGAEYHPALLAHSGRRIDVEQRLWRGQSELLLPILNYVRIRICDILTESFGKDWPINPQSPQTDYELKAVADNPRGAEFGHIEYLLKYEQKFRNKSDLLGIVSLSRTLRNEIAHYRLVPFKAFESLWKEMERLELT